MDTYLLVKSLHIVAVISWMVGMLYLPRLFVYHVNAKPGGELDSTLCIMEQKLIRFIINPAMIATLLFGIALVWIIGTENLGVWFHVKLFFVLVLFAIHGFFVGCAKKFKNGVNRRTQRFFRIINEVPAVIMIIVVVLAVLKPW